MSRWFVSVGVVAVSLATWVACSGAPEAPAPTDLPAEPAPAAAKETGPAEAVPSLLVVQAQFATEGGKPKPLPAKLTLLRYAGGLFTRQSFADPDSNVFHKAIAWRGGLLTIGAQKAMIKHWKKEGDEWKATVIWERSWGGKFDRFRDLEIGDVDGDGKEDIVVASHDQGVIAVGREQADGTWKFDEMNQTPDTFVHEVEIGDVDGDGKKEFYATPSARNQASGASQPGSVYRYDFKDGAFVATHVIDFVESHAKEISVHDMDGDGKDELYVVREAENVKEGETTTRKDPVRIFRYTLDDKGAWQKLLVSSIDDDQCRFLVYGDANLDGKPDFVAAAKSTGLWLLTRTDDGTFSNTLIDKDSGGFEHATHMADLDGDKKLEIYVAADDQKEFRQYKWNGASFDRKVIGAIGPADVSHITWNIQDGVF